MKGKKQKTEDEDTFCLIAFLLKVLLVVVELGAALAGRRVAVGRLVQRR